MVGDTVFLVRGVSKRYGSREILSNLTFDVRKGEILGIIGASGAGKTTLLHMLVGFIPSSSGDILFHAYTHKGVIECNVLGHHKIVNSHYGFASQRPSFYEQLTVLENLEYFGAMYSLSKETIARNAEVLLRLMELKASAHLPAAHLSGGMQRRLDIACALIHNPPLLILDEPTADLDPVLRTQIWEVIKRINARGTTIILSSHHLNELDTLCSRIGIIKEGRLVDLDTPQTLKSKYSKTQQIMVETFPGSYDSVIKRLHSHNIRQVKREGTYLTITSENPEHVITLLLTLLHRMGESLVDLKLIKPSLDDVFVTVYRRAELKDDRLRSDDADDHESINSVNDNALRTIVDQLKENNAHNGNHGSVRSNAHAGSNAHSSDAHTSDAHSSMPAGTPSAIRPQAPPRAVPAGKLPPLDRLHSLTKKLAGGLTSDLTSGLMGGVTDKQRKPDTMSGSQDTVGKRGESPLIENRKPHDGKRQDEKKQDLKRKEARR
ncbi:TPA: ABC transporter ATP-binding protein [Candidatus Woesearchaeota archaeon]|nr:ABC transporter ATP-binding protein [Candidatus Woesearchaeota archaeon]